MPNKHHHEGTGKFKSTSDVKGFSAKAIPPVVAPPIPPPGLNVGVSVPKPKR